MLEQRLNKIADSYRVQGFKVVVQPTQADLPDFAKDFKVEILAKREDVSVLASVKKDQAALAADSQLADCAESTNQQAGWRYDLFVLGGDDQAPEKHEAKELSEEEMSRTIDEVLPDLTLDGLRILYERNLE